MPQTKYVFSQHRMHETILVTGNQNGHQTWDHTHSKMIITESGCGW